MPPKPHSPQTAWPYYPSLDRAQKLAHYELGRFLFLCSSLKIAHNHMLDMARLGYPNAILPLQSLNSVESFSLIMALVWKNLVFWSTSQMALAREFWNHMVFIWSSASSSCFLTFSSSFKMYLGPPFANEFWIPSIWARSFAFLRKRFLNPLISYCQLIR